MFGSLQDEKFLHLLQHCRRMCIVTEHTPQHRPISRRTEGGRDHTEAQSDIRAHNQDHCRVFFSVPQTPSSYNTKADGKAPSIREGNSSPAGLASLLSSHSPFISLKHERLSVALLPREKLSSTLCYYSLQPRLCIFLLLLRRWRGITLRDNDGPISMSRDDLVQDEGALMASSSLR